MMRVLFYQLTRSFAFAKIEHPQLKWVTFYLPSFIAIISLICFVILPIQPRLTGDGSVTRNFITLLSTLPGFFIAALAAVATFQRETLDEVMPPPAPTLVLTTGGNSSPVELTMRMFLSHMFAFLTGISFLAILICMMGEILAPNVNFLVLKHVPFYYTYAATQAAKIVYVALLTWIIARIAITTLFGMYFLAERIHRPRS